METRLEYDNITNMSPDIPDENKSEFDSEEENSPEDSETNAAESKSPDQEEKGDGDGDGEGEGEGEAAEGEEGEKPKAPQVKEPDPPKKSYLNHFFILLIVAALIALGYVGYKSVKRRFMSVDSRIKLVNEYVLKNEDIFNRLKNYDGMDYNLKFKEYLKFLIGNGNDIRLDLKLIFHKKPKYRFKTKNTLLIVGRSKKEYYKNIKKKRFLIGDYKKYLEEVVELIATNQSYKTKPHKNLGKPYRKSKLIKSEGSKLKEAQKSYSAAKAKYNSYSNRLKEKLILLKRIKLEYMTWKQKKKDKKKSKLKTDAAESEENQSEEEEEKKKKDIIEKEGRTDSEILADYKSTLAKEKLEIRILRDQKAKIYQKAKILKSRYKKLKRQEKPGS